MPPVRTSKKRLSDAEYLEHMTRKLFISGFSWGPVEKKWSRFREVFYNFDPAMVSDMPEPLIEHISLDAGIIRNRIKIRATVRNAQEFLRIADEHGSFWKYLRSLDGLKYGERSKKLAKRFLCVGPNTAYYFLRDCGEPVPSGKPEGVK